MYNPCGKAGNEEREQHHITASLSLSLNEPPSRNERNQHGKLAITASLSLSLNEPPSRNERNQNEKLAKPKLTKLVYLFKKRTK